LIKKKKTDMDKINGELFTLVLIYQEQGHITRRKIEIDDKLLNTYKY